MKAVIIHRPERTDREEYINKLIRTLRSVTVMDAIICKREGKPSAVTHFGSAFSHLLAITAIKQPTLVLEDDAILDEQQFKNLFKLPPVPQDCGAILLGGDNLPQPMDPWTPITEKYFGVHAVIYQPVISKTRFFETAWRTLAMVPTDDTICYESLLQNSLIQNGLKLYRPPFLPATAAETFSDRSGEIEGRENTN